VRGVLIGSLLAVLVHPRWWLLALAGFLARGGLLLLAIPLIPVPTTAGLANAVGPTLVGFVFGGVSPGFLVLVVGIAIALAAWILLGGLAGAATDLALVRAAAADEELDGSPPATRGGTWGVLALRLLAHVPTILVLAWAASPIVAAGYDELIHPGDPAIPVPVRVILRVPDLVLVLVVAWIAGEAAGGLAVREHAWGRSFGSSFIRGWGGILQPIGWPILLLTHVALVAALAIGGAGVWVAFDEVRISLLDRAPTSAAVAGLVLLSLAWIGALVLVAVAAAWRSVAWTFELARRSAPRTIEPPRP
jgi:hypothetical protein